MPWLATLFLHLCIYPRKMPEDIFLGVSVSKGMHILRALDVTTKNFPEGWTEFLSQ